jgi:hypothetical protein
LTAGDFPHKHELLTTKMKTIILTTLTTILSLTFCFSQDVITKKTGEDIQSKVLEVGQTEVKYKKFDNQNGPIFTILKSEVLMVRYENGTKDIFNQEKKSGNISSSSLSSGDPFFDGQSDAAKYYKGDNGGGTGTLITSLLSPIVGLIPAISCSSTHPRDINLNYPNSDLMKNRAYYNGYTQKAKKIKQGRVWRGWGVGLFVNLSLILVLSTAQ